MHFDYEPFYVGKGKGARMYHHYVNAMRGRKGHRFSKIRAISKAGLRVIEMQVSAFEPEALAFVKEALLIEAIGRSDLRLGPLTNHTDGGEGASGALRSPELRARLSKIFTGRKPTAETRARMSAASKLRPVDHLRDPKVRSKVNAANTGRVRPQSERDAISLAFVGVPKSKKHRENISRAAVKRDVIECPHCGLRGKSSQMRRWHFDNCKLDRAQVVDGCRVKPKPRQKLSNADRLNIEKLIRNGVAQKDICTQYGVCRETIRTLARSLGL